MAELVAAYKQVQARQHLCHSTWGPTAAAHLNKHIVVLQPGVDSTSAVACDASVYVPHSLDSSSKLHLTAGGVIVLVLYRQHYSFVPLLTNIVMQRLPGQGYCQVDPVDPRRILSCTGVVSCIKSGQCLRVNTNNMMLCK